jgi:hypothetical protein
MNTAMDGGLGWRTTLGNSHALLNQLQRHLACHMHPLDSMGQSFPGSQLACLPPLHEMLQPGQCFVLPTLQELPPAVGHTVSVSAQRSKTETCFALVAVNGSRCHPAKRSRRRRPAIRPIKSSSDGQA